MRKLRHIDFILLYLVYNKLVVELQLEFMKKLVVINCILIYANYSII